MGSSQLLREWGGKRWKATGELPVLLTALHGLLQLGLGPEQPAQIKLA